MRAEKGNLRHDRRKRQMARMAYLRIASSFAIATASAAVLIAAPAIAQTIRESASGHGTLLSGGEKRQFSFTAQRQADGSVKGQATLINPAFGGSGDNNAPYQLKIGISCMKVVGNIAVMGGTTKRTNDANLMDAVFFSVQDNGEPGKGVDRLSRAFFWDDDPATEGDPQACQQTGPNDFPLEAIEAGNIQVKTR
jgi:hypothetical protein